MRLIHMTILGKMMAACAILVLLGSLSPFMTELCAQDRGLQDLSQWEVDIFTREDARLVINLQDAVQIAMDESFDIYRLQERYLQLAYGLEAVRRSLKTRIHLDSTLPRIQEGIINRLYTDFQGTLELWPFDESVRQLASSLNVVQPLITNGQITLGTRLSIYQRTMKKVPKGDVASLRYVMPRLSIQYTQRLFQFNPVRAQLKEARLDLEALQLSYGEVEMQRINEITRAFYDLFGSQRLLKTVAEIYEQSELNYQISLRRFELGMISEMEKLSLEIEMVNTRDRLISEQLALEKQQLNFKRKLGLPLRESVWVEASEAFVPIQVDFNQALEYALANRSDYRQARIEVEKVDIEADRIASRGRPDLQLNLGYDISMNSTLAGLEIEDSWSDHLSAGFDGGNSLSNTNVSVSFRVPLFDWRTNDAQVNRILSERRVLEREAEEVQEDLLTSVIGEVAAVQGAMQRMAMQEQNRNLARMGYEISLEQFEKGEIRYTELLLAQRRYLETETLFTNALIDYEMAKAKLREVTMYDWEMKRPVRRRTIPPEPFERGR